jgi:hypothetical protein
VNHIRKLVVIGVGVLLLAGCSAPAAAPTSEPDTSTSVPGDVDLSQLQGVPATFPSDVPIIDGDVPVGVDLGTGWSIVVQVDDYAKAYVEASGKLTDAGFETIQDGTSGDGSFGAFQNDKYQVQVTATDTADYGPAVAYVVVLNG